MPREPGRRRGAGRSPSSRRQASLARWSSRHATGPLPIPTSAAMGKETLALRGRRPRRWRPSSSDLRYRHRARLQVPYVIDSADDHPAIALFQNRHRCVLDPKRKYAATRTPDHVVQSDLDDPAVRDHEHITLRVAVKELVERNADTRLEGCRSLAARHEIPVWLLGPAGPCLRVAGGKVFGAQAFPLTEIDLAELGHRYRVDAQRFAGQPRRLGRALQVAG